jgi:hypothetical protein
LRCSRAVTWVKTILCGLKTLMEEIRKYLHDE